jgi:hypothetical protein
MKLVNSRGHEVAASNVLKIGQIYDALSISIDESGKDVSVRIHGGKQPTVHSLSQFKIVDPSIPRNWGVHGRSSGGLFLGPLSWSEIGFWERCFACIGPGSRLARGVPRLSPSGRKNSDGHAA